MLTQKQIKEIREHLDKAQNPIFFFDNDVDGLCSYLLLRRSLGKGKGVAIKSFPELDQTYARKITELNADYVFILDKPRVSEGFLKEVEGLNLPLVWIDHHDPQDQLPKNMNKMKNVFYYNPAYNKKPSNEANTYLCYKISGDKQDLWLAVLGCISDGFVPKDLVNEFKKTWPELWPKKKVEQAFDVYFDSDLGKIIFILSFALKDRTSKVVAMLNLLTKIKSPQDILIEDKKNYAIHKRYNQVNKFYTKYIEKAKKFSSGKNKILYFQYGGEMSLSSDISNYLHYYYPKKIIMVVYIMGGRANVSMRGNMDIRKITLESIKGIEGASGGGHKQATGAKMPVEDLEKFKENFLKALGDK